MKGTTSSKSPRLWNMFGTSSREWSMISSCEAVLLGRVFWDVPNVPFIIKTSHSKDSMFMSTTFSESKRCPLAQLSKSHWMLQ